jgi:hypothetical protein
MTAGVYLHFIPVKTSPALAFKGNAQRGRRACAPPSAGRAVDEDQRDEGRNEWCHVQKVRIEQRCTADLSAKSKGIDCAKKTCAG